jgi:hypothetical protein
LDFFSSSEDPASAFRFLELVAIDDRAREER